MKAYLTYGANRSHQNKLTLDADDTESLVRSLVAICNRAQENVNMSVGNRQYLASPRGNECVIVDDYFAETRTSYQIKLLIDVNRIVSTAELSPFLRVAAELEAEFGSQRSRKAVAE